MKKVLFIEAGTTGGGSFESLYQYLKIIDRNQFAPFVICFNKTKYNKLWEELNIPVLLLEDSIYTVKANSKVKYLIRKTHSLIYRNIGVPFYPVLRFVHNNTIKQIRKYIRENAIEIVYLNNQIQRDLVFVIAAKKMDVKIISHQRSIRGKGFTKKMAAFSNKNVNYFIANSNSSYLHWEKLGLSSVKMKVLYNFMPETTSSLHRNKDYNSIINIGVLANFSEAKGHGFLIDSFKDLVSKYNNYRLILGGHGSNEELLRQKVVEYKIEKKVQFLGYVNRDEFFSKIDILIVPSKNETFGRVILEGMQAGIPVIATKVGGIPEIISDKNNGLLFEYGDRMAFFNSILTIVNNNGLRDSIIINGKKTIKEKFSKENYLIEISKTINELSSN